MTKMIANRRDHQFKLASDDERDRSSFCELSNSLYARKVDPKYYSWQFFRSPFPSVLSLATAEDGGLAGCYGLHVQDSQTEEQCVAWAVDIMIAHPFQKKGLFRTLAGFAETQASRHNPVALCVMANERADGAHLHSLGWRRINVFTTFCSPSLCVSPAAADLNITPCENFDVCLAILSAAEQGVKDKSGRQLFSNRRSVDYLNWRFVQNPRYSYDLFIARRGETAFGYLVLKVFLDPVTGQSFGDIVDILWIEDDHNALADMLRFALSHFHTRGVPNASVWLQTNSILDQVGREVGFRETEQKRYFSCKVLDDQYRWLEDPSRWFITMADSEVY